ncbi:hypothetical protein KSS87_020279 [Heliosperma pusillum]|nr:hypothetical protein KSS87_020279 [Heliosperma pusillum]
MSQPRQFHMSDTTYTKLFVGGLAWETQRDTMKKYFEQFGEILEAVVITDKTTGRSKGYGFVTFKEPEAAFRACQNPTPVIDGRRANCNLASFGVQKNQPPTPQHVATRGRYRPSPGLMTAPTYPGSSSYFHQPSNQPPFPYSPYGIIMEHMVNKFHHTIKQVEVEEEEEEEEQQGQQGVTATTVGVMAGTLSGPSQVSTGVTSEQNSTT